MCDLLRFSFFSSQPVHRLSVLHRTCDLLQFFLSITCPLIIHPVSACLTLKLTHIKYIIYYIYLILRARPFDVGTLFSDCKGGTFFLREVPNGGAVESLTLIQTPPNPTPVYTRLLKCRLECSAECLYSR